LRGAQEVGSAKAINACAVRLREHFEKRTTAAGDKRT
jgi:hypothetical protein